MAGVRWERVEAGWYRTTDEDGVRYEVVNMQGQSVRYTGLGAHVEVRKGGSGDLSLGAQIIHHEHTIRDAQAWTEDLIRSRSRQASPRRSDD